jgi:hypothetical protein
MSAKICLMMNFHKNRLIHWIAAAAIAMSALAPAVSQAVSLVKGGHGFVMEFCSAVGNKISVAVEASDQVDLSQLNSSHCPYCATHTSITLAFNANLTFATPTSFALLPQLFYQSPKPLSVWVTPPSAAPPAQA